LKLNQIYPIIRLNSSFREEIETIILSSYDKQIV